MLWCYGDYDPGSVDPPLDQASHERSFGLWRADGSAKPAVEAVAAFSGATRVAPPDDGWIDIDADRYWQRPGDELPRLYERSRRAARRESTVTARPTSAERKRGGRSAARCDR